VALQPHQSPRTHTSEGRATGHYPFSTIVCPVALAHFSTSAQAQTDASIERGDGLRNSLGAFWHEKLQTIVVGELEPSGQVSLARSRMATHRLMTILAVFGFSVPIIAYFWLIHHYGVNMIYGDQWSDVKIIRDSYSGKLGLDALWATHNENRIFFPNLIVLLLSRTTNFNVVFEEYVSGTLLVISIGLLILAHRRRAGPIPWVYYCPIAILMLSFVQYQNALGGFQMAWYLVLFAVAVVLILLDIPTLTGWVLAIAIAAAVVASFSSLQGLIIWPVGLLLLYYRRRTKVFTVCWITAAVTTVVVYFVNDPNASSSTDYVIRHPMAAFEFYFATIGDVVGANVSETNSIGIAVMLLGLAIVLASIWILITYCRPRDELGGSPIAAALICFGLLFAALVTEGRIRVGLSGASQSRYTTFDLLIVVGIYMAVLEQFTLRRATVEKNLPLDTSSRADPVSGIRRTSSLGRSIQRAFPILAVGVVTIVCLQVGIGIQTGLAGARASHAVQVQGARVVVNINRYPDTFVAGTLGVFESANFIRQMAETTKVHHLSLFGTDAVAEYKAEGLIVGQPPVVNIVFPKDGADLKGTPLLDAIASAALGVTKVEFEVTGEGLRNVLVSSGKPSLYGWLAFWHTTTVPNGKYILECVAYTVGNKARSLGIGVVVKN
jgi:Bacterial Ig domain